MIPAKDVFFVRETLKVVFEWLCTGIDMTITISRRGTIIETRRHIEVPEPEKPKELTDGKA